MAELGQGTTQSLINLDLAGRVVQVVIASDDMGDAHGGIVDDH
jgi:hypothetical protein